MGKVCIVVVAEISNDLILGTDFWMAMDIVPNLRVNFWNLGNAPEIQVADILSE